MAVYTVYDLSFTILNCSGVRDQNKHRFQILRSKFQIGKGKEGSVVRKVHCAIHWIVIFQPPQKGIKSDDAKDIEFVGDKK